MELLDDEKVKQSPIVTIIKIILCTLFASIAICSFYFEFVPDYEEYKYYIVYSSIAICVFIATETFYKKSWENLFNIIIFVFAFILMVMIGSFFLFLNAPATYYYSNYSIKTQSGTFFIYEKYTNDVIYCIKKQYNYTPFIYTLESWNNEPTPIQLDTSNNIVFANNEPIWNLTTDEFIPRINR